METLKYTPFILLITLFITSCTSKEEHSQPSNTLEEIPRVELDSLDVLLSPDNSYLNSPYKIELLPDGKLAILDTDQLKVLLYDQHGELATDFGRRGKGPGEFVAPRGLNVHNSTINVIDVGLQRVNQFDQAGNFIRNYNIKREASFFGFVATGDSMEYYTVANGYKGSLVGHHIANSEAESTRYFGEAVVKNPPPVNDTKAFHSAAANGEIPDAIKNDLMMAYANGSLYVLLKNMSRLQKYNDGELMWDRELNLPVNDIIFNNFAESVQDSPSGFGVLRYVGEMTATSDNIYILWNGAGAHPQQVVKVSTDGDVQRIYQLPDKEDLSYSSIAVDESRNLMYLGSSQTAMVYTVHLQR